MLVFTMWGGGAVAQLRPCRIYMEAVCRGETDPDWEYVLRGACFGYRVIDQDCVSAYFKPNYSSITKGVTGEEMGSRVRAEIEAGILSVVPEPCVGAVSKGHADFRAIVGCSTPHFCVNDHTMSCRNNFSYNSVETDQVAAGRFPVYR